MGDIGFSAPRNGFFDDIEPPENDFFHGDDDLDDDFVIEAPEITAANSFPLSQDIEMGHYQQCAVCEYELRHCEEQCAFRMSLPGNRQGREDYAKCVLVYGDNHLRDVVVQTPLLSQSQAIESIIAKARERFKLSSRNEYNWILVNSYLPFSWNIKRLVRSEPEPDVNFQAELAMVNGFPGNGHAMGNGRFPYNQAMANIGFPGYGDAIMGDGFPEYQAMANGLLGNHHALANVFHDGDALADLLLGHHAMKDDYGEMRIIRRPCAVCEYMIRDCQENCIFRSSFMSDREGREDFARCMAVYGENLADQLTALLEHQQATMRLLKIRALRTFERRRSQAYDEILINLRKQYPWGWLKDPQQLPGVEFLPCMVCVSKRRNMCPQNCIFAPFFPHGRQAQNDFDNCLEKYGQDAANFLSGHTDTRQQQRIMLLTRCARPLGDGSSYADDMSFVADLLSKYNIDDQQDGDRVPRSSGYVGYIEQIH